MQVSPEFSAFGEEHVGGIMVQYLKALTARLETVDTRSEVRGKRGPTKMGLPKTRKLAAQP